MPPTAGYQISRLNEGVNNVTDSDVNLALKRAAGTNVFDKVAGGVVNSVIALAAARGIHKVTGAGRAAT